MIKLSNGHSFEYMVASGALGFDGRGWLWEKPLIWTGLMKPELFTVVLRTLTLQPRLYPVSNLSWVRPRTWVPWSSRSCVQFLPNDGAVNKVGLYNPGINWWIDKVAPTLDFKKKHLVGSIFGTEDELTLMAAALNQFDLIALEVNVSCVNSGHALDAAMTVISSIRSVKKVSSHPIIAKLSYDQDYQLIARETRECVEAISLNSVPWDKVYPYQPSPMERVGNPGSGKGGVSGKPAQSYNWSAVYNLTQENCAPVIAPGIMEHWDLAKVRKMGANAVSFGAIHLRTPWKPTQIVLREYRENGPRWVS